MHEQAKSREKPIATQDRSTREYDHRTIVVRKRWNFDGDDEEEVNEPTQHIGKATWTGPTLQEIYDTPRAAALPTAHEQKLWIDHLNEKKKKEQEDDRWSSWVDHLNAGRDAKVANEDRDAKIMTNGSRRQNTRSPSSRSGRRRMPAVGKCSGKLTTQSREGARRETP